METFDPFAVLGLKREYAVDAARVRAAYLSRSAELHPDVLGDEPEMLERSAELNRAREVLEDAEQRAIALWKLMGGGSAGKGSDDRALPPGFLMEMMEVREKMEAELASGDAGKVREWEAWGAARRREHQRHVAAVFAEIGDGVASAAQLQRIKLELNAWRYVERMMEQVGG